MFCAAGDEKLKCITIRALASAFVGAAMVVLRRCRCDVTWESLPLGRERRFKIQDSKFKISHPGIVPACEHAARVMNLESRILNPESSLPRASTLPGY